MRNTLSNRINSYILAFINWKLDSILKRIRVKKVKHSLTMAAARDRHVSDIDSLEREAEKWWDRVHRIHPSRRISS